MGLGPAPVPSLDQLVTCNPSFCMWYGQGQLPWQGHFAWVSHASFLLPHSPPHQLNSSPHVPTLCLLYLPSPLFSTCMPSFFSSCLPHPPLPTTARACLPSLPPCLRLPSSPTLFLHSSRASHPTLLCTASLSQWRGCHRQAQT